MNFCFHNGAEGNLGRAPYLKSTIFVTGSKIGTAAASGSIAEWIERNLDFGEVMSSRGRGGSGWAEFTTYDTSSGKKLFVKTSRRDAEMFIGSQVRQVAASKLLPLILLSPLRLSLAVDALCERARLHERTTCPAWAGATPCKTTS